MNHWQCQPFQHQLAAEVDLRQDIQNTTGAQCSPAAQVDQSRHGDRSLRHVAQIIERCVNTHIHRNGWGGHMIDQTDGPVLQGQLVGTHLPRRGRRWRSCRCHRARGLICRLPGTGQQTQEIDRAIGGTLRSQVDAVEQQTLKRHTALCQLQGPSLQPQHRHAGQPLTVFWIADQQLADAGVEAVDRSLEASLSRQRDIILKFGLQPATGQAHRQR